MRFNIPCKAFSNAVNAVSKVINSKNSLIILDNFLLELNGENLYITGSDIENSLSARVSVSDVEGSGKFCLGARRLVELLKALPDQGLTVTINDDTLEVAIRYAGGEYNLNAINGSEYPEYRPADDGGDTIEFDIDSTAFAKGLEYTIFAVGQDDYRPMMKGVYLDIKDDKITFVATDTHKLVRYDDSRRAPGVTGSCILPVKPATVIRNVFTKDSTLHVSMNRRNAIISDDDCTLKCSFINGRFPPYERVIPQSSPFRLTIDRLSMLSAARRVGVFVDSEFGLEKFKITPEKLLLKSEDNNMCTCARETVSCSYNGPEMVIGFSAPFIIEFLNNLPTEEVFIDLSDPSRAGVFRPSENTEGTELLMLLMPMNVDRF
ncbi:MAG: DNA polymerase III subunit beta [Odoribacter sp.]|nr:DNA polymerase III subunit beta [Odoribacter sp.]